MGASVAWGALVAAVLAAAGCTGPDSVGGGNKGAAQAAYDTCLASAAHFADTGKETTAGLAQIVAPMCYEQYLALEKDIADDLGSRARRQFERDADGQQIGFATTAIRAERGKQQLAGVIQPH